MQMWRAKTYLPFQEILPEATPRRHGLLRQTLSLLAQTHSLGGRRKAGGSFLTLEMSGMCGDYRMGGGGTCKTALPISPAPSLQGCRFWGAPACIDQGLKWSPVEQP